MSRPGLRLLPDVGQAQRDLVVVVEGGRELGGGAVVGGAVVWVVVGPVITGPVPGTVGVAAGFGNAHDSRPSVALAMYFCQICAGNDPPVTDLPWTSSIRRPSSG